MHENRPPGDGTAGEMASRVRAVIERMKPELCALSPKEAEAVLSAELGDDRRAFNDRDISRLVRYLQDPWWSVRHPVQAMRELRRL